MTKIYAIPGLRLGYVMASAEIIERLSNYQPHWSVNSIAMKVGELCLEEDEYVRAYGSIYWGRNVNNYMSFIEVISLK